MKIKENLGYFLLFISLAMFFLLKLPFNLSVLCGHSNEGFYYIFSQYLLNSDNRPFGGPLFILIYAIVLKIFGFGTSSIIAIHFLHTLIIMTSGILIFLIANKMFQNNFYSGLAVFLWFFIKHTPLSSWLPKFELMSAMALEAENVCVLFSLCSIYLFLINSDEKKAKLFSFLSALFALFSYMCKSSGAVFFISVTCWFFYLLVFRRDKVKQLKTKFLFFFLGLSLGLLIFGAYVYLQYGFLFKYFIGSFLIGNYSTKFLETPIDFVLYLSKFMMRHIFSPFNFLLFLLAFIGFGWGLVRFFFIRLDENKFSLFWSLLSIWGIGSVCAAIAPGDYGSQYYVLVWPSVAIFLVFLFRELFLRSSWLNKKIFKISFLVIILFLFVFRVYKVFPYYYKIATEEIKYNFLSQPQSFLDPVLPYDISSAIRPDVLKLADLLNSYLPNKNDTFYVLNFVRGHGVFDPPIYIYTKRVPPTVLVSDYLRFKKYRDKIPTLINDLSKRLPKLIIVPKTSFVDQELVDELSPFFNWFDNYLESKYHLKNVINYPNRTYNRIETYLIYERNQ